MNAIANMSVGVVVAVAYPFAANMASPYRRALGYEANQKKLTEFDCFSTCALCSLSLHMCT